jgi:hypothetical protein
VLKSLRDKEALTLQAGDLDAFTAEDRQNI